MSQHTNNTQNDEWQIAFVKLSREKDENGCKSVEDIRLEQDFTLLDLIKMRKLVFEQSLWNIPKPQSSFARTFESRSKASTAAKRAQDAMMQADKKNDKKRRSRPTLEQRQRDKIVFFKSKDPRKNPEIGLIIARYMIRCSKRRALPSVIKQRTEMQKKKNVPLESKMQYTRKWILHPNAAEQFGKIEFTSYDQVDAMIKNAILSGSAQELNIKPIEKQIAQEATNNTTTTNKTQIDAASKDKSVESDDDDDDDDVFVVDDDRDMAAYQTNVRRAQQDQRITYPIPRDMISHIDQSSLATTTTTKNKKNGHTRKYSNTSTNITPIVKKTTTTTTTTFSDNEDDDNLFSQSASSSFIVESDPSDSESDFTLVASTNTSSSRKNTVSHITRGNTNTKINATPDIDITTTTTTTANVSTHKSKHKKSSKKRKRSPSPLPLSTTPPPLSSLVQSQETQPEKVVPLVTPPRSLKNKHLGPRSLFDKKQPHRDENSSSDKEDNESTSFSSNNNSKSTNRIVTSTLNKTAMDKDNDNDEVILNILPALDKRHSTPLVLSQPQTFFNKSTTGHAGSSAPQKLDVSKLDEMMF